MSHPSHISGGDYLLVPRRTHVVLTVLSIIVSWLLWLPSLFLWKKSFVLLTGYSTLAVATGFLLWIQVVPRNRRRYVEPIAAFPPKENVWFRIPNGSDVGVGVFALLASITCGLGGAMLTSDVINCVDQTPLSLAQIVFGSNLNTTAVTDWTTQYRVPFFATSVITSQSCLDDYALLIVAIVMFFINAVVMLIVGIVQWIVRDWTIGVLERQRLRQQPPEERGKTRSFATVSPTGAPKSASEAWMLIVPPDTAIRETTTQTNESSVVRRSVVKIQLHEKLGIGTLPSDSDT